MKHTGGEDRYVGLESGADGTCPGRASIRTSFSIRSPVASGACFVPSPGWRAPQCLCEITNLRNINPVLVNFLVFLRALLICESDFLCDLLVVFGSVQGASV